MTQDSCPRRDDPEVMYLAGLWVFPLLVENEPVGFAYRLLALNDPKAALGGVAAVIDAGAAS